MKLSQKQVNKKYKGKYIDVSKQYDHENDCYMYEVRKTYREIHENTTLGEDVGTELAYRR